MNDSFEMVAKTFQGLEDVLAEELRGLGAENVTPGRRMVSFKGDLEMLYRANLCCRTALRILKPFHKFTARDTDSLYEKAKEFDWSQLLSLDKTFAIDTVANGEEFTHSQFATYRIKDAIVDWFKDRYGEDKRPGVRLKDADVMFNVHISGAQVTLSLDSSGESLHKRGYRVAQTEAPINEVLAAGIILRSGWRGETPFVDPMCGSGTFLIEAALIAANINPGIYRKGFAFEHWRDFDADLFDKLYNDDSGEREVRHKIYGADISPRAVAIAKENIKNAGVSRHIELATRPISKWEEAPKPAGVLISNPPYGERISSPDMEGLYTTIGSQLKHVFTGYHAWLIGYRDEYFAKIGLAPSQRIPILNGSLECELREYVIFEGDRKSFVREGGKIGRGPERTAPRRDDRRRAFDNGKDDGEFRRGRRDDEFRRERGDRREFKRNDEREERGEFRRGRRDDEFRRKRGDRREFKRNDEREERGEFRRERGDFHRSRGANNDVFKSRSERPSTEEEPENPLAKRRNADALKSIRGLMPSLPPQQGPVMRSRGWKKKSDEAGESQE